MQPSTEAMTLVFEDVSPLITTTVWKFWKEYGGDYQELKSVAYEVFLDCCLRTYDKDRGTQFTTWLVYKIEKYLLTWMRLKQSNGERAAVHAKWITTEDYDTTMNLIPQKEPPGFSLADFLLSLTEDSAKVVQLTLNPPVDLKSELKAVPKEYYARRMRSTLRQYLYTIGWTAARVTESFAEIRKALQ